MNVIEKIKKKIINLEQKLKLYKRCLQELEEKNNEPTSKPKQ